MWKGAEVNGEKDPITRDMLGGCFPTFIALSCYVIVRRKQIIYYAASKRPSKLIPFFSSNIYDSYGCDLILGLLLPLKKQKLEC
jgi:hypothetical protein